MGSRSVSVFAPIVLVVLATVAPVYADDLTGTYEVKFEPLPTNCEHPLAYPQHGTLKIEMKSGDLIVDIERTPIMVGKPPKTNKVSAKSPKPGHTPVQGMDGMFTIGGRITPEGMLSLMMIGEYQTAGKSLCTQSWNISGLRSEKPGKDKPKSDKPARATK